MAHVIEVAKSGRASCRTCKQAIGKGELRLGEEVRTQFSDAPSLQWHHLMCAAKNKPAVLAEALKTYEAEVPDRAALEEAMASAAKTLKPGTLPYADRAPTGRAKCIGCSQPIAKGELRVAVEREVDTGMFMGKSTGYLHPACAAKSIEDDALLTTLKTNSPALEEKDLAELQTALASAPPATPAPATPATPATPED